MSSFDDRDENGWTTLHHAVKDRDLLKVERSLKDGANVNAMTTASYNRFLIGTTPLHIASYDGELEIVRFLVDNGANVNAQNNNGSTPIHLATWHGFVSIVEFLAFQGADVNKSNKSGITPIHISTEHGYVAVTEILCAFGADPNPVDKQNRTPLMNAVRSNHIKSVRFLVELNADSTMRLDWHGWVQLLLSEHSKKSISEREQIRIKNLNRIRFELGIRLMRYAQPDIVGICLAMSSLDLPPYVLLWIIDWLPNYDKLSHHKKIRLIESVRNSIWKLKRN